MCLELPKDQRYSEPQIATKDIVVYKIVIDNREKQLAFYPKGLVTPYQYKTINIGSKYRSTFTFDYRGDIEKGLHSFANLKTAKNSIKGSYHRLICKCVIPKGSKYYKGKFFYGRMVGSYASSRLNYIGII